MKVETSQAISLVKRGRDPKDAAAETGCPLSTLYAALRKHCPLPKKRVELRASPEDVERWVRSNLEIGFSYRENASEIYRDFREFVDYRYLSAIDLNRHLREVLNLHMVRSNGKRWVVGARLRDK